MGPDPSSTDESMPERDSDLAALAAAEAELAAIEADLEAIDGATAPAE